MEFSTYVISCKQLGRRNTLYLYNKCTQEKLATFFIPNSVPNKNLLLLLSEATIYMIKAGYNLQLFYPILKHVTCLAHELQDKLEKFPSVNELILNLKKAFLKASLRVQQYKQILLNIPLPLQPPLIG